MKGNKTSRAIDRTDCIDKLDGHLDSINDVIGMVRAISEAKKLEGVSLHNVMAEAEASLEQVKKLSNMLFEQFKAVDV